MRQIFQRFIRDILWFCRVIYSAGYRFYWDNGFSKAAALGYTTLFSLVPITVFGFGILASVVLSDSTMLSIVRDFIFRQFIPSAAGVDVLLQYLSQFSRQMVSLLSFSPDSFYQSSVALGFLVVSCFVLLNSIEFALNEVWQVYESRSIPQRIMVFCTIIVLVPIFAISAFYANLTIRGSIGGGIPQSLVVIDQLAPFVIDLAAFATLYYLVPKISVRWRNAILGGFVAAVLFDIAKGSFTYYVAEYSSYEKVYGTVSTVLIFLFWLYLSWSIVLFGAEVSYQAQHLPATGRIWRRKVLSVGDGVYLLAIQLLLRLGRSHESGSRPPTELELAEELGCTMLVLRPIISSLKKIGYVGAVEEEQLVLLKSPEFIQCAAVREILFGGLERKMVTPQGVSSAFKREDFSGTLADLLLVRCE